MHVSDGSRSEGTWEGVAGGEGGGFKPSRFLGICLTPISCHDTLAN